MARKHKLEEVLKSLSKKNDVRVLTNGTIEVLNQFSKKRHNDLGNSSWGKIDYLVKVFKFTLLQVSDFS